jgi:hypothetical protein
VNKRDRARFAKTLREAGCALREAAADQSYRRDAMKSIREGDLARFHNDQWVSLHGLAQACVDYADLIDSLLWPELEQYTQAALIAADRWTPEDLAAQGPS